MHLDPSLRREVKYVANEMFIIQILGWIETSRLCLRKHFPDRLVNNIYYDSHSYDAYADNVDGISQRTKLRYRWYGSSPTPVDGNIELKKRLNACGVKEVYPVVLKRKVSNHIELVNSIKQSVPAGWTALLDFYSVPIILNRYHRSYYTSKCRQIRVTVDRKHHVMDQRFSGIINTKWQGNTPQYIIVEIKFASDLADYVSSMIDDIPMRYSRNSKYINAVNVIR